MSFWRRTHTHTYTHTHTHTHRERNRLLGPAQWERCEMKHFLVLTAVETDWHTHTRNFFLSVSEDFIYIYIYVYIVLWKVCLWPLVLQTGSVFLQIFFFLTAEECEDYVSERQVQRLALITLSLSLSLSFFLRPVALVFPPSSSSLPVKETRRGTNSRDGEVKQFGDRNQKSKEEKLKVFSSLWTAKTCENRHDIGWNTEKQGWMWLFCCAFD